MHSHLSKFIINNNSSNRAVYAILIRAVKVYSFIFLILFLQELTMVLLQVKKTQLQINHGICSKTVVIQVINPRKNMVTIFFQ